MSDRRRMSMQSAPYPSANDQWANGGQSYAPYGQPPASAYRGSSAGGSYSPDGYYPSSPTSPYPSGSGGYQGSYTYGQPSHSPNHPYPKTYGHAPTPASAPAPASAPTRPRSHSQSGYSSHPVPQQYPQQVPLTQATSYNDYPPSPVATIRV
ncbi:hypothetical protein MIND_00059500 [Mycena indigotica]|uniref:Uncharacterized protein n=1 Tax=Mycena indigotica TaxID=2126181 RepID=A0A8H6TEW5_9AGAR|nr:uncharacterized protein MIND_00059500 [Mycena indigotica]KAF7315446.1 hypothetical protein MIND_00059500 [Mycena indigotica]